MVAQSNVVVPVVICNEPLASFEDELRHLPNTPEPSADYVSLTADLFHFHAAATIYDSEKETWKRDIAISSLFSTLLLIVLSGYTRRGPIRELRKRLPLSVNPK